jgi:hypothetical protein
VASSPRHEKSPARIEGTTSASLPSLKRIGEDEEEGEEVGVGEGEEVVEEGDEEGEEEGEEEGVEMGEEEDEKEREDVEEVGDEADPRSLAFPSSTKSCMTLLTDSVAFSYIENSLSYFTVFKGSGVRFRLILTILATPLFTLP